MPIRPSKMETNISTYERANKYMCKNPKIFQLQAIRYAYSQTNRKLWVTWMRKELCVQGVGAGADEGDEFTWHKPHQLTQPRKDLQTTTTEKSSVNPVIERATAINKETVSNINLTLTLTPSSLQCVAIISVLSEMLQRKLGCRRHGRGRCTASQEQQTQRLRVMGSGSTLRSSSLSLSPERQQPRQGTSFVRITFLNLLLPKWYSALLHSWKG